MCSGGLKTRDPELALWFRCMSLFPGAPIFAEGPEQGKVSALARQEPWFSSARGGVSSLTGWLGTGAQSVAVIPAVRCRAVWPGANHLNCLFLHL